MNNNVIYVDFRKGAKQSTARPVAANRNNPKRKTTARPVTIYDPSADFKTAMASYDPAFLAVLQKAYIDNEWFLNPSRRPGEPLPAWVQYQNPRAATAHIVPSRTLWDVLIATLQNRNLRLNFG